jgi:hypothetical protein
MNYEQDIKVVLEIHLCDYLDNCSDEIATAFKDLFGRNLNDIEARALAHLIEKRLGEIEVVW